MDMKPVLAVFCVSWIANAASVVAEPAARRWTYRMTPADDAKKPVTLVLVEAGRRALGRRLVLDLVVELGGKRATADDLSELGMSAAPFDTFAPTLALVVDARQTALILGGPVTDGAALASALADATVWRLEDGKKKPPRQPPSDRRYAYGRKVGAWRSICSAYLHPSPDTGDTFESELCAAPGIGVTLLDFDSVWGGYRLELVEPPADAAAALTP